MLKTFLLAFAWALALFGCGSKTDEATTTSTTSSLPSQISTAAK